MSRDPIQEDDSSQVRKRLWGAAVLIAIAVIILPLLLDGGGSESQFRRVESLRQEPPAIVDTDGTRTVQEVPEMRPILENPTASELLERVLGSDESEMDLPDQLKRGAEAAPGSRQVVLSAWVVQAGAFREEGDALLVRDQLRQAGFASFVRDRELDTDPFRVLVGPMIKKETAEVARDRVGALLQTDALVTTYP